MELVQTKPSLLKYRKTDNEHCLTHNRLCGNFSVPLHIAVITDTWRPDINGVALTCGKMVDGLASLGANIQLVQPVIQDKNAEPDFDVVSVRGIHLPFYREVTIAAPARLRLRQLWIQKRPDVVLIVTEGLLGRSALLTARKMGIPVISEYHTNFQQYTRYYGFGVLER